MMQIWVFLLRFQKLWPGCRPSSCSAGYSHGGLPASVRPSTVPVSTLWTHRLCASAHAVPCERDTLPCLRLTRHVGLGGKDR